MIRAVLPPGCQRPLGGGAVTDENLPEVVPAAAPRPAAARVRLPRRPVHGVLLLDKPLGLSSNQALQKVKWLLRAEKAGHTGTLDPLASGVLPLCFGAATKFSQLHLEADKVYVTTLRLGLCTSTGDAEGAVIASGAVACSRGDVERVLERFRGPITQLPPMHSALKKDGKALYEYARAGLEVERTPRAVTIYALDLLGVDLTAAAPWLRLRVHCSKGTYIRSLGADIGAALGCGAHLMALRRVQTGAFGLEQCLSLEHIEAQPEAERLRLLQAPDVLLGGHTRVTLDSDNAARFLHGMRRRGAWDDQAQVAVYGQHPAALLGTAHIQAGELIPDRLLSPLEIQQTLENPL